MRSRRIMPRRLLPLLLLAVLVLPGCLNYEQHTRLEEDGSGTAEIHYWIGENVFMFMKNVKLPFNEDSIRQQYSADGVTVLDARTGSEDSDSTRHVWISLAFDDIRELSDCDGFKDVGFRWQSEGDVFRFEQSMPASGTSSEEVLRQFTFTYTYEFPGVVRESNADTVDGNRAVWVFPLSEMGNGVTLTATVEASSGANIYWVLGIILAVLLLALLFRALRKRKN